MKTLAKIVRVVTVAPVMALLMLIVLYAQTPEFFGSAAVFALSVIFLTILPLSAYPLQPFIKKYRDRGREGQRTLAMVFAVCGYVLGCATGLLLRAPRDVCVIYISYLLSGALIMLINRLFGFKASGHACGVTGPSTLLLYFGRACGWFGAAVLLLVWVSSVVMKRHTNAQFAAGAAVPIAVILLISAVRSIL